MCPWVYARACLLAGGEAELLFLGTFGRGIPEHNKFTLCKVFATTAAIAGRVLVIRCLGVSSQLPTSGSVQFCADRGQRSDLRGPYTHSAAMPPGKGRGSSDRLVDLVSPARLTPGVAQGSATVSTRAPGQSAKRAAWREPREEAKADGGSQSLRGGNIHRGRKRGQRAEQSSHGSGNCPVPPIGAPPPRQRIVRGLAQPIIRPTKAAHIQPAVATARGDGPRRLR